MAVRDRLLQAAPILRGEQVAVQVREEPLDIRLAEQEAAELLRENVVRPHGVPGLGCHFLLRGARLWHRTEVDVGQEADFIVVVEHHAPVAGDAEVLQQHVAGKDVGGRQLLDGVAVLIERFGQDGAVGVLDVQVQRRHGPFGVEVADAQLAVLDAQRRRGGSAQLVNQLRVEAVQGQAQVLELLGVGHAPSAVMAFDDVVLLPHFGGRHRLLRRKLVANHLENRLVGREGKHRHHHALDARGGYEQVLGLTQVIQKTAVELGFAVLVLADGGIKFGALLVGQQFVEEADQAKGVGGAHHEVGPGETEHYGQFVLVANQGVHVGLAPCAHGQWQGQRPESPRSRVRRRVVEA